MLPWSRSTASADDADGAPSSKRRAPWKLSTLAALMVAFMGVNTFLIRCSGPAEAGPVPAPETPHWLAGMDGVTLDGVRASTPRPRALAEAFRAIDASVSAPTAPPTLPALADALLRELEVEHRILSDSIRAAADTESRTRLRGRVGPIEEVLLHLRALRAEWIARDAADRQSAADPAAPHPAQPDTSADALP